MPLANSMVIAQGMLTTNMLYFKCLLCVFSSFIYTVPYYSDWAGKVGMKRKCFQRVMWYFSLEVFPVVLKRNCTFDLKKQVDLSVSSGRTLRSAWFVYFSVVQILPRAHVTHQ